MYRLTAIVTFVTLFASAGQSVSLQEREGQSAAAQVFSARNDDWKAPELRITIEEYKRLEAAGDVLVVDVRDRASYRQGHLPGAILLTPEELSTDKGQGKLKGEKRTIVTYCS